MRQSWQGRWHQRSWMQAESASQRGVPSRPRRSLWEAPQHDGAGDFRAWGDRVPALKRFLRSLLSHPPSSSPGTPGHLTETPYQ